MAYSETVEIVVGDTRPVFTATIRDKNTAASGQTLRPNDPTTWAPINLSGATVRLYVRELGSTTLTGTLTGVLVTPADGTVAFTVTTTTFPAAGVYEGEVEITYSDTGIQTIIDLIKFKVRAQLA